MLFDVGGLALLLYIDHKATRDISNAFNASDRMQSGLCEPMNKIHESLICECLF